MKTSGFIAVVLALGIPVISLFLYLDTGERVDRSYRTTEPTATSRFKNGPAPTEPPITSILNKAVSLYDQRQFLEAQSVLESLPPSVPESLSAVVQRLRSSLQFHLMAEQELPLYPIVENEAIPIRGRSGVRVDRGVVQSINLSPGGTEILLYNPTEDRVKPNIHVLLLNADGVILLQHHSRWLIDSLDHHESHTISVGNPEFPPSLAFSKWAVVG